MASKPNLVERPPLHMRFTVDQYHRMIETGVLTEGEPYELVEGSVVRKDRSARGENSMTVGHEHAWVVKKLAQLSVALQKLGCDIQTQQPIVLPPLSEPEPDAAVIVGNATDYSDRHPAAKDILCVIEVADSSLPADRTTKLQLYARAGIATYVLINLVEQVIEVYTAPAKKTSRYEKLETLKRGDTLLLPAARNRTLKVPVKSLIF